MYWMHRNLKLEISQACHQDVGASLCDVQNNSVQTNWWFWEHIYNFMMGKTHGINTDQQE